MTHPIQAATRSRQTVLWNFCGVSAMRSFSGQERTWFEHTALSQIDRFSDIPQQGALPSTKPLLFPFMAITWGDIYFALAVEFAELAVWTKSCGYDDSGRAYLVTAADIDRMVVASERIRSSADAAISDRESCFVYEMQVGRYIHLLARVVMSRINAVLGLHSEVCCQLVKRKLDGQATNQIGRRFTLLESIASVAVCRAPVGAVLQFNRAGALGYPIFLLVPIPLGASHLGNHNLGASQERLGLAPSVRRLHSRWRI
jgi:hypothetical protein